MSIATDEIRGVEGSPKNPERGSMWILIDIQPLQIKRQ